MAVSIVNDIFSKELSLLYSALLNGKSVFLYSPAGNPSFIFSLLKKDEMQKKFFNEKLKFKFIFVDNTVDINETLNSVHGTSNLNFEQLALLLSQSEVTFVICFTEVEPDLQIKLFGLKMYFNDKILFVFPTHSLLSLSKEFEIISVNPDKLSSFVKNRIEKFELDLDLALVLKYLNNDIDQIDEVIISLLQERIDTLKHETRVRENEKKMKVVKEVIPQAFDTVRRGVKASPVMEHNVEQSELEMHPHHVGKTSIHAGEEMGIVRNAQPSIPLPDIGLSEREEKIYEKLLNDKFISREDLGKIVWGRDAAYRANPDAIDQVISRLRRKFVRAGYDKSYISSRKGEGVVINE